MSSDDESQNQSHTVEACIYGYKGSDDRHKWTLPCFSDFGKNKQKLILTDSQLKVRNIKMAQEVPSDACLVSYPGASTSDLLWLLTVGRVTKRGEDNFIFTHNPSDHFIPSVDECKLENCKFLDHASFITNNFTTYRCHRCRENCYTGKVLIFNIGINNYLYRNRTTQQYLNKLNPIATLKTISKLLKNIGLKNFHFINVPKIRCPIIQQKQKLHKKIMNDISEYNKLIRKIHSNNNGTDITFSEIHLKFRSDQIHLDEQTVISVYKKIATL